MLAGLCDLVVASHYARWDGPEYAPEAPLEDAAASPAFEDDDGFSSPVGPASDENEAPSGAA